jgi:enamine deaminase RidA (YjgF/YER057c/UK114 family)
MATEGTVQFINPPTMHKNPAFTNVVVASGTVRTIYIGGQDSVDGSGAIVGKGDFQAQARQVLTNIQAALEAAGAELRHLVKWNIYVVQGQDLRAGFQVFQRAWGVSPNPPAISVLIVSGLAHPGFLLEMDAIAVVPESPPESPDNAGGPNTASS